MTADEFREALAALRLSQGQLARAMGIDVGTVNRWANGRRAVPAPAAYAVRLLLEMADVRCAN